MIEGLTDPTVAKAVGSYTPGSAEAKAAMKKAVAALDHDGDGKPDSYAGKGMEPSQGGRFAQAVDQGLVDGMTLAQAKGAALSHMHAAYGPEGTKALLTGDVEGAKAAAKKVAADKAAASGKEG